MTAVTFPDLAGAATVASMDTEPGRCTCGLPDCSDAPYVLPTPEYVHRTGPDRPKAPVIPAQRRPVGCWTPVEVAS